MWRIPGPIPSPRPAFPRAQRLYGTNLARPLRASVQPLQRSRAAMTVGLDDLRRILLA
jgi:hypothetical protein